MKEKILSVKFHTAPLVRQRILNRSDKSTIVVDKNGERTTLWKDKENYPFKLDNSIIVTVDSTKRKFSFKIPEKYSKNKQTMEEFLLKLYSVLDKNIFTRAQNSLSNDKKRENAHLTLTIKSHLEQRIEDIKKVENSKVVKPLDLTIKMWDRIPQKDLFQGNYSTCCIGLGKGNGRAMPHYILNTAFNMIEMVDNKTGKTIGNALCYFAKNNKNEIVFVVDNIEIANKNKPSSQAGIELRKTIVSYVQNILKEVCPNEDIKIYLGASYNDVPVEDLDEIDNKTSLYGDFDCSEIYLDAFGGWSDGKTNPKKETSLYCLN